MKDENTSWIYLILEIDRINKAVAAEHMHLDTPVIIPQKKKTCVSFRFFSHSLLICSVIRNVLQKVFQEGQSL